MSILGGVSLIVLVMTDVQGWPEVTKITHGVTIHILTTKGESIFTNVIDYIFDMETFKDLIILFDTYYYLDYVYVRGRWPSFEPSSMGSQW